MSKKKYKDPERLARRAALWILYAADTTGRQPRDLIDDARYSILELEQALVGQWSAVEERVHGVNDRFDLLNEQIQEVSPRWKLERMALIDRNILRLGAWELFEGKSNALIVINACIELAKEYGEKGTPAFVNGLLDQLCKNHKIAIA